MNAPAPLTSPDCDLRDFAFMPVDIIRLFGSRFHAVANDAEWRAGVTLWLKSFHQVPAASVPDDDVELARLAEFGRDIRGWKKVREIALHGWIKCSDGRYYHPVVAEKANEAAFKKDAYRERSRKANAKRWGRLDNPDEPQGGATREERGEGGSRNHGKAIPEKSNKQSNKDAVSSPSASQGTVRGTVIPPDPPRLPDDLRAVMEAGGFISPPPDAGLIGQWKAAGADFDQDILPTVRRVAADVRSRSGKAPFKLQLFDRSIREKLAADAREIERLNSITRRLGAQA